MQLNWNKCDISTRAPCIVRSNICLSVGGYLKQPFRIVMLLFGGVTAGTKEVLDKRQCVCYLTDDYIEVPNDSNEC